MKIRTQLILAFLLLSVLPLTGIVLYSYYSSQQAVRAAELREAEHMAQEMDRRVAEVRSEVGERVARLGDLPVATLVADAGTGDVPQPVAGRIAREMRDIAPFVEAIEFVPAITQAMREAAAAAPDPASFEGLTAVGEVADIVVPTPPAAPVPSPMPAATVAAAPPSPPAAPVVVIDVEQIMRDVNRELEKAGVPMAALDRAELRESIETAQKVARDVAAQQQAAAETWARSYEKELAAWEREVAKREQEGESVAGMAPAPPTPPVPRVNDSTRALARLRRHAESIQRQQDRVRQTEEAVQARAASRDQQKQSEKQVEKQAVSIQPLAKTEKKDDQTRILFGKEIHVPVERQGEVVGEIRPRIRAEMLIASILGVSERGSDEIPFAIDREGNLYAPNEVAKEQVEALGVTRARGGRERRRILHNWVVATSRDEESGLTLGIARPIREPLADVRRAAGRNFAYGIGLIGIALIGMIPLANHMTRDVELVTEGAERIAQGDLDTEVPVRSKGEFGALAAAFNRMARDLRHHQSRLVEEERRRKDEEIQRRLLAAEFERKSDELEEARRFQLSLLPKELPRVPGLELAVFMRTATEVGGDYYDFHVSPGGDGLTVAIGDATGHGARAGTMVTIVKSLFSTYSAGRSPAAFLTDAGETVRRMELGRMTMALQLARVAGGRLTLASAGMPPALLFRAARREVEELAAIGMPLGSFDGGFTEVSADLAPGDVLLLMSDGFPELLDRRGDPLGYPGVAGIFAAAADGAPQEVVDALAAAASARTGGDAPNDDITFVVVKVA